MIIFRFDVIIKGLIESLLTCLVLFSSFSFSFAQTKTDLSGNGNRGVIHGSSWSEDGAPVEPVTVATITLSEVDTYIFPGYKGDTALVAVNADLNGLDLYSSEMHFTGFQGVLSFEGIVTEGTPMGDADWNVIVNEQEEEVLITGNYGSDPINQDGALFYLKFFVGDSLAESVVSIEVSHVELNEEEGVIETVEGSVSISHLLYIGITETVGFPGDTVSVSVYANLWQDHSFEVTVAGSGGGHISAVAVDTAGTVIGSDWTWSYSITDFGNVVITAGSGAEVVSSVGTLFNVHFAIDEGSSGVFFPVFITDAIFNDEVAQFETDPGGVMVLGLGDVSMNGRVGASDASLILQNLVGLYTLSSEQEAVGDVTADNSLSALDAAIILDYVVGLVDELPYDVGGMTAEGQFVISGGSVEPGEMFQVPILLTDGSDIRSFELTFDYDPEALFYQSITWNTDVLSGLEVLDNQQDGLVQVSAAGMDLLVSGELTLGWIEFQMDEFFNDYQTSITISRSRANERAVEIDGSVAEYTNSMLVVSDWGDGGVPMAFALEQNYPNPFNPTTMIRYQLPEQTNVMVAVYDINGRKVRTLIASETQQAGYRQMMWNATNDLGQPVSAGMYIYTIQAGEFRQTKKMVLLK